MSRIKTVALGSQDLKVPVEGLGSMGMTTLAGMTIYSPTDETESIATIHRARELSVNFLDTADLYGPMLNERLVGKAVADQRQHCLFAPKFGYEIDGAGQLSPTFAIDGVLSENGINSTVRILTERVAQNSLGRLGCCGFSMTMDDDTPMATAFIARDFGNAQALGNLVHPKLLLAIERLSDDGRALDFFRQSTAAAAYPASRSR